jgi:hypothetical protein
LRNPVSAAFGMVVEATPQTWRTPDPDILAAVFGVGAVRRIAEPDLPDGLRDEEASGPTAHPPRLAAPARSTGSATTPSSLEHALTGPLGSCP